MLVALDGTGPLYAQLYRSLREQITRGLIPAGGRLPATRELAERAGLSRNVVLQAYAMLEAEGYTHARRGAGTFVSPELGAAFAAAALTRGELASHAPRASLTWHAPPRAVRYDFRVGPPDLGSLPLSELRRHFDRAFRDASPRALDYPDPRGARALRRAVAEHLGPARGVSADPDRVLIVSGTQQALYLSARVLVREGDAVVLEDPGYLPAREVFARAGARLLPVRADAQGLCTRRLPEREAALAYVTPSHQFPRGGVLPMTRRLALLAWARDAGAYVFEDDYDAALHFGHRPLQALAGIDVEQRTLHAGSFSKSLFPALRLGYLVLPEALVEPFVEARSQMDAGCPTLPQLAVASFLASGRYGRHVRRARKLAGDRMRALRGALTDELGERARVHGGHAGLHLLVELRGIRASQSGALRERALTHDVRVLSADRMFARRPRHAHLLLGCATLTVRRVRAAVRRLKRALDEVADG